MEAGRGREACCHGSLLPNIGRGVGGPYLGTCAVAVAKRFHKIGASKWTVLKFRKNGQF